MTFLWKPFTNQLVCVVWCSMINVLQCVVNCVFSIWETRELVLLCHVNHFKHEGKLHLTDLIDVHWKVKKPTRMVDSGTILYMAFNRHVHTGGLHPHTRYIKLSYQPNHASHTPPLQLSHYTTCLNSLHDRTNILL